MNTRLCGDSVAGLFAAALAGLMLAAAASAQAKQRPSLDEVAKQVMEGLKARFPQASIDIWTKEQEGEIVIYDFEFNQDGHKFEADIKEAQPERTSKTSFFLPRRSL